jgi:class 3 adenylate cyclase
MPVCAACGEANSPRARFCQTCGSALAAVEASPDERKLVTVLFADLAGSTGLGERLDPEHLKEVMGAYWHAMRDEIRAEQGTVEKFIGDAVVGVFGAPAAHEDDPARALRTALRMRRRLEDLNGGLLEAYGVSLQLRIGVNSGTVIAAGRRAADEGIVTGDPVAVAARLEQRADPDQILVSERTAGATRGFRWRSLGNIAVRGRQEPLACFELLGDDAPEDDVSLRPKFVGRDRELRALQQRYARTVSERRAHVVTVIGDPGIGKSRLIAEFLAHDGELLKGSRILRSRCLPYGDGVTYWPLADVLRTLTGTRHGDSPEEVLSKVRRAAATFLPAADSHESAQVAAALAYTTGLDDPETPLVKLPPRRIQLEVRQAWNSLFSGIARSSAVIFFIEDIHWAGSAMLDLIEDLAHNASGPLLILCTARPELVHARPGWGAHSGTFSTVSVGPLPERDADRLTRMLLGAGRVSQEPDRRVFQAAEGNPFFLEEIVRKAVDETRGGAVARSSLSRLEIPDTVQAVLAARIDMLGSSDKRVLQASAVVGREFWKGCVARIINGEASDLEASLKRLEGRELIMARPTSSIAGEQQYSFRHGLTKDVAYDSVVRRERARCHGAVGHWIEDLARDRTKEYAELLAHHYGEAHQLMASDAVREGTDLDDVRSRAFAFALLASEEARRRFVLNKAESLGQRALSLARDEAQRSLALEALGERYLLDYLGDPAWQHLCAAAEARLKGAPHDEKGIARLCARALESPTRWGAMRYWPTREEAGRYLEMGLAHAGSKDSEELVRLLIVKAAWPAAFAEDGRSTEEDYRAARETGEEAAAIASRLGLADLASAALDEVASTFSVRGLYGEMARVTERRLDLLASLHDPREVEDVLTMRSWASFNIGLYEEACRAADDAYERSVEIFPAIALHPLAWRGLALYRLGDWDGLHRDVDAARKLLATRTEAPASFAARVLAVEALVHEVQGDASAADAILATTRALGTTVRDLQSPWVARLLARRGATAEARAMLDAVERLPERDNLGLVLEAKCDVVAEEGAWDDVAAIVAASRAHAQEAELLALPSFASRLEGRASVSAGRVEEGEALLRSASDGFARLGARWEKACTDVHLARALAMRGKTEMSRSLLSGATEVLRRLNSTEELALAEELMTQTA